MRIFATLLPLLALNAAAQSFQYTSFAQIRPERAFPAAGAPPAPAAAPAQDPIEALDRSTWKAMTVDQWRACEESRRLAQKDPQNYRVSDVKDEDGRVWTKVGWRWTIAGENPPVSGWTEHLCAAGRLLKHESWGPLARFTLSADRKELILWTGPMPADSGYAPTDMFYWRLRADEVLAAKADSRLALDGGAWLHAWALLKNPTLFLEFSTKKGFGPGVLDAALALSEREGLLGKGSAYADSRVRAAVAARAAAVVALKGDEIYAHLTRDRVFVKNMDERDEYGRLDAPSSDFVPRP